MTGPAEFCSISPTVLLNPHLSLLEPQLSDPDRTELMDACLAGVLALPPLDPLWDRDGDGGDAPYSEVGRLCVPIPEGTPSISRSWGCPFSIPEGPLSSPSPGGFSPLPPTPGGVPSVPHS